MNFMLSLILKNDPDFANLYSFYLLKALIRNYEADLEALTRQQKQQLERFEQQQDLDLKTASKRVKAEQVCNFSVFKILPIKNKINLSKVLEKYCSSIQNFTD